MLKNLKKLPLFLGFLASGPKRNKLNYYNVRFSNFTTILIFFYHTVHEKLEYSLEIQGQGIFCLEILYQCIKESFLVQNVFHFTKS